MVANILKGAGLESPFGMLGGFYRSAVKTLRNIQVLAIIVVGNAIMFPGAYLFYVLEAEINPGISNYWDAIWWAFTTVTTVGYGDVVPITHAGRVLAIFIMIGGVTFFVGFTAVFIPAVMAEFTRDLVKTEEVNIREIVHRLERIEHEIQRLINMRR